MNEEDKDIFDDDEIIEKAEEKKGFLASKKGFWIICAVSVIAIGVASYIALSSANSINKQEPIVSAPEKVSSTEKKVSSTPVTSTLNTSSAEIKESATTAPPVATYFIMPVSGGEVFKGYSGENLVYSNTYGDYRSHLAVDLTSVGETVTSCGDGIVTEVGNSTALGNYVVIDHGNEVIAKYCGLGSAVPVKVGDTVNSKTVLGNIGSVPSECLDKAHLHLEFTKSGKSVDPLTFIK